MANQPITFAQVFPEISELIAGQDHTQHCEFVNDLLDQIGRSDEFQAVSHKDMEELMNLPVNGLSESRGMHMVAHTSFDAGRAAERYWMKMLLKPPAETLTFWRRDDPHQAPDPEEARQVLVRLVEWTKNQSLPAIRMEEIHAGAASIGSQMFMERTDSRFGQLVYGFLLSFYLLGLSDMRWLFNISAELTPDDEQPKEGWKPACFRHHGDSRIEGSACWGCPISPECRLATEQDQAG